MTIPLDNYDRIKYDVLCDQVRNCSQRVEGLLRRAKSPDTRPAYINEIRLALLQTAAFLEREVDVCQNSTKFQKTD